MAVKYEKIVEEDLELGTGTVDVSMPGGGTATGHRIGPQSFPAIGAIATMDGGQPITGGASAEIVEVDDEQVDVVDWFDPTTFTVTPSVDGYYQIDAYLKMAAFSGAATVAIYVNSNELVAMEMIRSSASGRATLSAIAQLDAGDEVTLRVSHTDGTNVRNVDAARLSVFIAGKSA